MPTRKKKRSSGELPGKRFRRNREATPTACSEGLGYFPTSKKPSDAANAVIGRFEACEHSQALLADNLILCKTL